MLLSVAVTILLDKDLSQSHLNFAAKLQTTFVSHFSELYGSENISYNVHSLINLSSDVKQYGVLDNYSAFPFENLLGSMKRWLRTGHDTCEQLERRIAEREAMLAGVTNDRICLEIHSTPVQCLRIYQGSSSYSSSFRLPDSQFLERIRFFQTKNGQYFRICNILQNSHEILVLCHPIKLLGDLFDYPCNPGVIGTFVCKVLGDKIVRVKVNKVKRKCLVLQCDETQELVVPILKHDIFI